MADEEPMQCFLLPVLQIQLNETVLPGLWEGML
jgi:hypothetical protein